MLSPAGPPASAKGTTATSSGTSAGGVTAPGVRVPRVVPGRRGVTSPPGVKIVPGVPTTRKFGPVGGAGEFGTAANAPGASTSAKIDRSVFDIDAAPIVSSAIVT